ncbi:fungal-specific transcription factor domain-containing protein [Phaeosphaeriaceae sp. PMI808]|nr:fungal-specific transcription factor domain-containing protein [Phaeosphaeriaceae sp. PMI808]
MMETLGNVAPTRRPSQAQNTKRRAARSKNENRHYRGLTCANCRARKMRCGGGQPSCKTCEIYNDECRYDKAPPMSQVMAMAQRLQEAEETIASLQAQGKPSPCEDTHSRLSPSPRIAIAPTEATAGLGMTPPPSIVSAKEHSTFQPRDQSTNPPMTYSGTSKEALPLDLSVDENGEIQYYGPTSAVHDPPQLQRESLITHVSSVASGGSSRSEIQSALMTYAQESKIWEEFALGNASLQTGIPRQIMAKLLHMHWTWVSPMFMYVYRRGDMATGGRYYSEFLLTVICAHAAKYQDDNCAEFLLTRMRRLLGTAIQQPSSIPTVQALLQLSARELANGSISQAWVYSGIAFRMASDLGLQHSSPNIRGLGPVDLEIRKRLFWSCYFWDKAISLYAGRLPAVTELLHHSTLDLLDDSMELEIWTPYYCDSLNLTKLTQNQYPLRKSHAVSCFANSCKLSIIINDIIVQLYSRRSRAIMESALRDIKTRLDVWRAESPAHLRYDPYALPSVCPPPHIISQNLLYYTTVILAHRPFWSVQAYYQVCIAAAQGIEKLVLLLESTFGLENITYLMGYCIYTGASAVLDDAKSSNQGTAHPVLRTFLRALNSGMRRCPLLKRSLNIIVRGLNHVSLDQQNMPLSCVDGLSQGPMNPYIPAFPYLDPAIALDFGMSPYFSDNNINSMAVLDCFPEMQLDAGDIVCPL